MLPPQSRIGWSGNSAIGRAAGMPACENTKKEGSPETEAVRSCQMTCRGKHLGAASFRPDRSNSVAEPLGQPCQCAGQTIVAGLAIAHGITSSSHQAGGRLAIGTRQSRTCTAQPFPESADQPAPQTWGIKVIPFRQGVKAHTVRTLWLMEVATPR